MGCDIHLYTEKRINGAWASADAWEPDEDEPERMSVPYDSRLYSGRNYNLFAILADVRNGRGFAGVETGAGFIPIAHPKGIPDDACPEIKREAEQWVQDGHSHSWLTVAELMGYDWTQHTKLCGYLNGPEFEKWNRWGRDNGEGPESYCGDVGGALVKKINEAEMIKVLDKAVKHCEKEQLHGNSREQYILKETSRLYCHCNWTQQYFQCCKSFLSETMPVLWRLGKPEDVRIVFFFDN